MQCVRAAEKHSPPTSLCVAVGAWTPTLLPELGEVMRPVGQPVFHLRPADPERFSPPHFVVFGADSSRTGWYGFPAHPDTGVVKIANHGPGWLVDPEHDPRTSVDSRRTASARISGGDVPRAGRCADRVHPLLPLLRHARRAFLDRSPPGHAGADCRRRRQRACLQVRAGARAASSLTPRKGYRAAGRRAVRVAIRSRRRGLGRRPRARGGDDQLAAMVERSAGCSLMPAPSRCSRSRHHLRACGRAARPA